MISGFKIMWLIVMFDLPTDTKKARRNYALFRKNLLQIGFTKMQFSVYSRCFGSREIAQRYVCDIERLLPPDGEVRLLLFTDKQYENMKVFWGKKRKETQIEYQCEQLKFF